MSEVEGLVNTKQFTAGYRLMKANIHPSNSHEICKGVSPGKEPLC